MNSLEYTTTLTTTTTTTNNHLSTVEAYVTPFSEPGIVVASVLFIPTTIFGIFANVLTIIVITRSHKLKSVFNLFIVSLCASDLISAIISPLSLYRRTWGFEYWAASDFLCKMFWALDLWTSYVTSSHILCFAILRYISVEWPHRFTQIKRRQAKITISIVWFMSFCVGFIPFSIWFNATKVNRSSPLPNSKWPSCTLNYMWINNFTLYTQVAYSLFFYIPIACVIVLSISIGLKLHFLRKNRSKLISQKQTDTCIENRRRRKENQILLQLGLIVGSFLIGYIPQTAFHLYTVSVPTTTNAQRVFDWWFGLLAYVALRLSECLNPIFYNLASSKMRKETKRTLSYYCRYLICCFTEKKSAHTISAITSTTSGPRDLQL